LREPEEKEITMADQPAADAANAPPVTGVTPYLVSSDARAHGAFCEKAFGADIVVQMPAEDGKRLMHSHLVINGDPVMICDAFPEHGHPYTPPQGYMLHLQVEDVQAWWDRAVAAGAEVVTPLAVQFWGDRYGQVRDPFGVVWTMGGKA
jgi:uncharacterized glyoxalase superfamily protein PhnB